LPDLLAGDGVRIAMIALTPSKIKDEIRSLLLVKMQKLNSIVTIIYPRFLGRVDK
jgi:hypothetical protein